MNDLDYAILSNVLPAPRVMVLDAEAVLHCTDAWTPLMAKPEVLTLTIPVVPDPVAIMPTTNAVFDEFWIVNTPEHVARPVAPVVL